MILKQGKSNDGDGDGDEDGDSGCVNNVHVRGQKELGKGGKKEKKLVSSQK